MFKDILVSFRNYKEGGVNTTVNADLLWCAITIVCTMLIAWYVRSTMFVNGEMVILSTFFAGVVQVIMYLQVITLFVLALSYVSKFVSAYRCAFTHACPVVIYAVIRIITNPEPVDDMYTHGATIAMITITIYNVKELMHYLYATFLAPAIPKEEV